MNQKRLLHFLLAVGAPCGCLSFTTMPIHTMSQRTRILPISHVSVTGPTGINSNNDGSNDAVLREFEKKEAKINKKREQARAKLNKANEMFEKLLSKKQEYLNGLKL